MSERTVIATFKVDPALYHGMTDTDADAIKVVEYIIGLPEELEHVKCKVVSND